jgi:Cu+-exporting ATPase
VRVAAAAAACGLQLKAASALEAPAGLGVVGTIEGLPVALGNARLLAAEGVSVAPLEERAERLHSDAARARTVCA